MITDYELCLLEAATYDPGTSWDTRWTTGGVYVYHRNVRGYDVIAFRGSDNMEDWLRDLKGWPKYHPKLGFCHAGFLEDMDLVAQEVLLLLQPASKVVVIGHSLGAARALILAALMTVSGLKPDYVVVWGEPRPGFSKLKNILLGGGFLIRSYKNRNDPVTLLPYYFGLYRHVTDPIKLDVPMPADYKGIPDHGISLYLIGMDGYQTPK